VVRTAVVARAAVISLVVGTALVLVNHGDHLAGEAVCEHFYLKCTLSYLTPFVVSLVSAAMAERGRRRPGG